MRTAPPVRPFLLPCFLLLATSAAPPVPPAVRANDNRVPAGTLREGVLTLNLVARLARWAPEGEDGPFVDVAAFGEEGGPPQIPAPTIRVPAGTQLVVSIRNALADSTLWVHGFVTQPAATDDSVPIGPGERRTLRFRAGAPGTYLYRATPGTVHQRPLREREQLSGAFVVDAPGERTDDRIFVINIWGEPVAPQKARNALAVNGRSWPHTEPLTASVGDTLRWRVVNGSFRPHPMHLHGFYFTVDSRGTASSDTIYSAAQRRLAVTEVMSAFTTMRLSFVPERPGNWLFHCHLVPHVLPGDAQLEREGAEHAAHSGDARMHMAGIVLGIAVEPDARWREPERAGAKRLDLYVNEGRPPGRAGRGLAFVQQRGARPPAADSLEIPGTTLVLTRGQPTDIMVHNRLRESTAVHWHGIELESWSDGVAGWSGRGAQVAPAIAPGDSFLARLTLPRAGTFMYHTHLNDFEQVSSGLYGAIVVLEPGQTFDPAADHVFVTGWDGDRRPARPVLVVNGAASEPPLEVRAGQAHRLRFANIGPAIRVRWELRRGEELISWRPLAKDGADLPAHAAISRPAVRQLSPGETFDAEFRPTAPGEYRLIALAAPEGGPGAGAIWTAYERRFLVR